MTRKLEKKGIQRMEEEEERPPKGTAAPRRERQPVSSATHSAYNKKVQPQGQVETSCQIYPTYHK